MPRRMIGPRFPSRTRGPGSIGMSQPSRLLARGGQRLRGSHSGNPCLPVRSPLPSITRSTPGSGDFELRVGLAAVGGTRQQPVRARRQAVEAEPALGVARGPGADVGQRDPDVGKRLALLVADRPTERCISSTVRAGPSDKLRADGLRADLGPALAAARRTRPRAGRRSPATPCTGRRPRSRSPTSRPCPARCGP